MSIDKEDGKNQYEAYQLVSVHEGKFWLIVYIKLLYVTYEASAKGASRSCVLI